jgi:hypothetical protein
MFLKPIETVKVFEWIFANQNEQPYLYMYIFRPLASYELVDNLVQYCGILNILYLCKFTC